MSSHMFFFLITAALWHVKVPRIWVKWEMQLRPPPNHSNTNPSLLCDLHRSLWQCQLLNPLSQARDQTCILRDNLGTISEAYGVSQARGRIGATAAGPHHSHSNAGSEPCL